MFSKVSRPILAAGMAALLFTGGCGRSAVVTGPVFFPPPPNPPKVQYLTSIATSSDVEGKDDSFALVLVGGPAQKKDRPIGKPYGIVADGTRAYVSDTGQSSVIMIDLQKKKFEHIKGNQGNGKLKKPIGIARDAEGNLFVADSARKDVVIYDKDGNFVKSIGKGLLKNPVGVAADVNNVYVLDNREHRIKVFDRKTDEAVGEIGAGPNQMDSLALPQGMMMDEQGLLHITNALSGKVLTFDLDGHLIRTFGKLGDSFGQFGRPRGIFKDKDGITYIVDASHQNVQLFNEAGRVLMFFGDPGLPAGSLNMPASVSVTDKNLDFYQKYADPSFVLEKVIFVTNQYGPDKVAIYGFGHPKGSGPVQVPTTPPKIQ